MDTDGKPKCFKRLIDMNYEEFEQQYLCQPPKEDNPYVQAWMAYHHAAHEVDGRLPPWDRSLNREAVQAGFSAMFLVLSSFNLTRPSYDDKAGQKAWQAAKQKALGRLRK